VTFTSDSSPWWWKYTNHLNPLPNTNLTFRSYNFQLILWGSFISNSQLRSLLVSRVNWPGLNEEEHSTYNTILCFHTISYYSTRKSRVENVLPYVTHFLSCIKSSFNKQFLHFQARKKSQTWRVWMAVWSTNSIVRRVTSHETRKARYPPCLTLGFIIPKIMWNWKRTYKIQGVFRSVFCTLTGDHLR
jgi:hypothetical protein